jgi:hypothetical protein
MADMIDLVDLCFGEHDVVENAYQGRSKGMLRAPYYFLLSSDFEGQYLSLISEQTGLEAHNRLTSFFPKATI